MNKGFTLIELMISIFILSVGIIAVYGAFSIMAILSSEASDRLTAAYLAQEGVEIIRNIRDTNWLNPQEFGVIEWDRGLDACENELGCEVDYTTTGFGSTPVYPWQETPLVINSETGFYGYDSSGTATKFTRKITIDTSLAPDALRVKAEVFWDRKPSILSPIGGIDSVAAESVLYDWY